MELFDADARVDLADFGVFKIRSGVGGVSTAFNLIMALAFKLETRADRRRDDT